eukprot:GHVR01123555.1.p1 GENE.GHVR01123555.1~~GHVR01123555.1.p1  ORF type:complete len:106 (+),score=8.88 GHVR01123555.1:159-476(+)
MALGDMLWHLDMLFQSKTKNPEVAQLSLERVMRGELEPAYRYGKRVLMLASAANIEGENLDLKAQRAFVAERKSVDRVGEAVKEQDTVVPKATLTIPVRVNTAKG